MDAGTEAINNKLREVAKSRDITYYATIAPLAGLDMGSPGDRDRISRILGDISTAEHDGGRPLLSAVVILRETNSPGVGFVSLAKDLGRYDGSDDDLYWAQEVRCVHDFWSSV